MSADVPVCFIVTCSGSNKLQKKKKSKLHRRTTERAKVRRVVGASDSVAFHWEQNSLKVYLKPSQAGEPLKPSNAIERRTKTDQKERIESRTHRINPKIKTARSNLFEPNVNVTNIIYSDELAKPLTGWAFWVARTSRRRWYIYIGRETKLGFLNFETTPAHGHRRWTERASAARMGPFQAYLWASPIWFWAFGHIGKGFSWAGPQDQKTAQNVKGEEENNDDIRTCRPCNFS